MAAQRVRFFGAFALAPLALGALASCHDDTTEQTTEKVQRFSDFDDDGMYISDDCMRPDGSDGCSVVPGPTECTYLEITTTTTVIVDASGNVVREETTECTKCLDADFNILSETCSGVVGPPVICEAVDAPTGGTEPGGTGGGTMCWVCTSEDGTTYYECTDPPVYCTSDDECPAGTHCEYYPPPPCDDPTLPCPATSAETDALIAPYGGQCVPDDPIFCSSDAECPEGWICVFYGEGDGTSGSDGSTSDAPIYAGGQCVPSEPPPPPECTSDADCGPGGFCVYTCDGGAPIGTDFVPEMCRGTCEYYPPCDCSAFTDAASCEANVSCDWVESGFVPCDPATGCGTSGSCIPSGPVPTDPTDPPSP